MRMYSAHHRVKLNMNMKGGPKIVEDDIYFAGLGVCWRRLCHPIPDSQYQFSHAGCEDRAADHPAPTLCMRAACCICFA